MSKPQPEQNTMYFVSNNANQVIDCAAALTAVNRKQYHMTKNLKPLLYHVRAQCVTTGGDADPIRFATAPNTWTTRNALTMFGKQYAKLLRNNSLRRGMLGTYGKEIRYGLSTGLYTHASGADGFGPAYLIAEDGANSAYSPRDIDGATIFDDYTNSDGAAVTYEGSNTLTTVAVPEVGASGEPETIVPSILGTSSHADNDFACVPEYLASRRNLHDHDEADHSLPENTSLMLRIGSTSDEHTDDHVKALEVVGVTRPYDEAGANTLHMQGLLMAAGDYSSFVAPCGLIKVEGNADSKFLLSVTAITEM